MKIMNPPAPYINTLLNERDKRARQRAVQARPEEAAATIAWASQAIEALARTVNHINQHIEQCIGRSLGPELSGCEALDSMSEEMRVLRIEAETLKTLVAHEPVEQCHTETPIAHQLRAFVAAGDDTARREQVALAVHRLSLSVAGMTTFHWDAVAIALDALSKFFLDHAGDLSEQDFALVDEIKETVLGPSALGTEDA